MIYITTSKRAFGVGCCFALAALVWCLGPVAPASAFPCAAPAPCAPPAVPVCSPAVVPLAPVCSPSPLFPPPPPLVAPVIVCPQPVFCGPVIMPEFPPPQAWRPPYRRSGTVRSPGQSTDAGTALPPLPPRRVSRPMSR